MRPNIVLLSLVLLLSTVNAQNQPVNDDVLISSDNVKLAAAPLIVEAADDYTAGVDDIVEDDEEDEDEEVAINNDGSIDAKREETVEELPKTIASASSTLPKPAFLPKPTTTTPPSLHQILKKSAKKALGGGLPGAAAGLLQVISLMWLRTIMNSQYRFGKSFLETSTTLWNEGGVGRFYKGLLFAAVQGPLSRFGSTAANDGVNSLISSLPSTATWGPGRTTLLASLAVGLWRTLLMPIDTCKTVLQVDGSRGFESLMENVYRTKSIAILYQGSLASALSSMVGHFPWFIVYNTLSGSQWLVDKVQIKLLRTALIGFIASGVSDCVSNSIRVIKTTKQSLSAAGSGSGGYGETLTTILKDGGISGLFGRGLVTRIFANGLQSIVFTVAWRYLKDRMAERVEAAEEKKKAAEEKEL
jgi:hypothetical protein